MTNTIDIDNNIFAMETTRVKKNKTFAITLLERTYLRTVCPDCQFIHIPLRKILVKIIFSFKYCKKIYIHVDREKKIIENCIRNQKKLVKML